MLAPLLLGSLLLVVNMAIQVIAVLAVLGLLFRKLENGRLRPGLRTEFGVTSTVLSVLFLGHLMQFATWALLFVWLGEFSDFQTAFYHSSVNFTSLGYGDIVMSERWRLLGGLEAANGVLMFGLTAGSLLTVMNNLFGLRRRVAELKAEGSP